MQAIILAAGYGVRLRPYTDFRPKPLFPVLNQPLLHRLLGQLRMCGCRSVVVNCHHLAEQIKAELAVWPDALIQHEPILLGTGGSLRLALDRLENEPVLVMNGDLYHEIDLERVYRHHLLSKNSVTLALHDYPRFNNVGIKGDRVRSFGADAGRQLAFTGIQVVDPEMIERVPADRFHHIIDLYRELAPQGRIGFFRVDGACWRDIGTPTDYLDLHRELLVGQSNWLVDPGARIGSDVVLAEWGCIGAGAVIGAGAYLCRSVVWDGAVVAPGNVVTDRIITGHPVSEERA